MSYFKSLIVIKMYYFPELVNNDGNDEGFDLSNFSKERMRVFLADNEFV